MKVILYPFNRVIDILDVVSFHAGLEGGVYANAHVTRAAQVGLGAGGGTQLGWWQKRELGAGVSHVAGLALGPFEASTVTDSRAGTRGAEMRGYGVAGINRPSDFTYQQHRDYWGIGVRAVAGIVGASIEIHPLELGDALAGFFFIDFLCDDFGESTKLKLKSVEVEAMQDLINSMRPEEIRARMRGRMIPPSKPEQEVKPEPQTAQERDWKVPTSPPPPPRKQSQRKTMP